MTNTCCGDEGIFLALSDSPFLLEQEANVIMLSTIDTTIVVSMDSIITLMPLCSVIAPPPGPNSTAGEAFQELEEASMSEGHQTPFGGRCIWWSGSEQ